MDWFPESAEDVVKVYRGDRFTTPIEAVPRIDANTRSMIAHGPGVPINIFFVVILEHCSLDLVVPLAVSQGLLAGEIAAKTVLLTADQQRRLAEDTRVRLADSIRAELDRPS